MYRMHIFSALHPDRLRATASKQQLVSPYCFHAILTSSLSLSNPNLLVARALVLATVRKTRVSKKKIRTHARPLACADTIREQQASNV